MNRHVYFEKQGPDRMCALHCLNGIVQGPAYVEADLQREAKLLDDEERRLLTPRSRRERMCMSSLRELYE
ncbi:MAG: hypothetical protein KVP17_005061 [Porospora cf. gigantea B]|uniref:uncharacterized protein n=1 Tax=Porospora cf. gigantea B TaxID=2853592 RepID=UPI003571D938|nr:MAG: hypothetical protein KVP17_005061 [Porospora cf. gigantea B]